MPRAPRRSRRRADAVREETRVRPARRRRGARLSSRPSPPAHGRPRTADRGSGRSPARRGRSGSAGSAGGRIALMRPPPPARRGGSSVVGRIDQLRRPVSPSRRLASSCAAQRPSSAASYAMAVDGGTREEVGELEVVEADERELPAPSRRGRGGRRWRCGCSGEERGRRIRERQQLAGDLRRRRRVVRRRCVRGRRSGSIPAAASASQKPLRRSRAVKIVGSVADHRDAPVSEPEQVLGRRPRAADVVEQHGVGVDVPRRAGR